MVLRVRLQGVDEHPRLAVQCRLALHDREDLSVVLVDELDEVREVAPVPLPATFRGVDAQQPQADAYVLLGTHPEKVLLLIALVQGLHHHAGCLRGVDDVCQVLGRNGVAAVRLERVLEVDAVELRQCRVAPLIAQQGVVYDLCQVGDLEVIEHHRVPVRDHLLDERVEHGEGLAGSGRSDHKCPPEGVLHGDEAVMIGFLPVVTRREHHGPVARVGLPFLLEGFLQVVPVLVEAGEDTADHGEGPYEPGSTDERGNQV